MAGEPRQATRLFHAIVLAGAALGGSSVACGPATSHTCNPDASADAAPDGGDAGVPCDPDAWPPTK